MTKHQQARKRKNKKLWLLLPLLLLILILAYYQLWYRPQEVQSNIVVKKRVLTGHRDEVWVTKFSPDGKLLASGSVDSSVKFWNASTGALVHNLKTSTGVTSLAFSADGKLLATSGYDGKVRLWNLPDGHLVKELTGPERTVWHVAFNPDGTAIAGSSDDGNVYVWHTATGQLQHTLKGHQRIVWSVKFSPDGNTIASASFDATVKLWNAKSGQLQRTLTNHTEAVVDLAFSHNGQLLATTSDDKTIKLWRMPQASLWRTLTVPEHVQAAAFSPNDQRLLTGGRDKPMIGELLQNFLGDSEWNKGISMRLWDVASGTLLQTFADHANDVNDVAFSPDGNTIASASADKTVGLWRVTK